MLICLALEFRMRRQADMFIDTSLHVNAAAFIDLQGITTTIFVEGKVFEIQSFQDQSNTLNGGRQYFIVRVLGSHVCFGFEREHPYLILWSWCWAPNRIAL